MTFTIKCNACGKETVFSQGGTRYIKEINKNNEDINLYTVGYDEGNAIECVCGNEVQGT